VSTLDRMLDALPPIYAVDEGSVLRELLGALALELEAYAEDLDRLRRTHWFTEAYRVEDLAKIAALVGVARRSWEPLEMFRERVRAVVDARLAGSVGPHAVRTYVYEAVRGAEEGLDATLVPGLRRRAVATPGDRTGVRANPQALEAAFRADASKPAWRPLQLIENPERVARSASLAARRGLVPYLHRWTDVNHGLADAPVTVSVTGRSGGLTATPVLANLTTGQAIVYVGVLRVGQELTFAPAPDAGPDGRVALAQIDGHAVTDRVFSISGFALGAPFSRFDGDDPGPLLPVQQRGSNEWAYLSAGLYDVRGLDATYFQLADDTLREGAFDTTSFDEALFVSPVAARLEVRWTEREPAAFTVVVPRGIVAHPAGSNTASDDGQLVDQIGDGLAADLDGLRAAGVRSHLDLRAFVETQEERCSVSLPWVVVPAERGPAGESIRVGTGGRFSDSRFGGSRFE